jgi:hypothetical protein
MFIGYSGETSSMNVTDHPASSVHPTRRTTTSVKTTTPLIRARCITTSFDEPWWEDPLPAEPTDGRPRDTLTDCSSRACVTDETQSVTAHLVTVLRRLDTMAEASIHRSQQIKVRIQKLLARLEAGEDLTRIVETEGPPGIPDLITASIEALHDVGATLRRAEAAALRAYGHTMEQIADLFGVSRQRISALLKDRTDRIDPVPDRCSRKAARPCGVETTAGDC